MKAKKNKKLKGMTLIECIIAMVVLAITGLIMVRVGALTNRLLINANHVNNKTQAESRVGSVNDKITLNDYCTANATFNSANEADITNGVIKAKTDSNGEQDVTFSVGTYGTVNAKRYNTKAADGVSAKDCDTNLNDNASLQFYDDFS
ncbi:MAG: prepilin-type N-terminal cleavage/methylation domain-containing protein [Oscillospiraceae bacterium]|nr:prepilin-type N-terminal cleavage/methylation domain-containing protein [Oscillospiraceae bacterium]